MPLQIQAPFAGWCCTLDEVPDPVFAGRMLGDGVAVDPTEAILHAPCAGEIIALPASAHAVSIRTPSGIEILVHIGIDTVSLAGRGFSALKTVGAVVAAGEALIRFDFDVVARGAKSLITPILVQGEHTILRRRVAGPVATGDPLFELAEDRPADLSSVTAVPAHSAVRELRLPLQLGLHARPAALIAQKAKAFRSALHLVAHGKRADARSVTAMMTLGLHHQDALRLEASGADAQEALDALLAAIGEAQRLEAMSAHAPASTPVPLRIAVASGELAGITAVPGYAVGRATRIERRSIEVAETGGPVAHEQAELARAQTEVRARLVRLAAAGGATRREIVKAHLEFVDDPALNADADEIIAAGKSAGFAWRSAVRRSIEALQRLDDARLRERADDLLDIETHVLLALAGEARPMLLPLPERAVVLAADLLPSELTALDREHLVAICLANGGATSHVAILAAAMQIPMLVGLGSELEAIEDGASLVVDADRGRLETLPTSSRLAEAQARVMAVRARSAEQRAAAKADCYSLDGTRIEVFANLGNAAEAAVAVDNGAEGCGLLRTEFLFLERDTAPSEEEQRHAYQEIVDVLDGRPAIIRLMDVGGDKPLRYLPLPHEDNPALGLRGVRTVLLRPDLLRAQLRAALAVKPAGRVRLLLPMITDGSEISAVRTVVDELRRELSVGEVEIGAMIETPAAALIAAHLIKQVDFLSIGSNDLTQYTLAMDRGHPQLAARIDALHPAVLKLMAQAIAAGVNAGKLVAVCGGVAADLAAVPILLGLGVREFSVVPGAVPGIKQRLRTLRVLECRDVAMRCLELGSAAEVRLLIASQASIAGDIP
jgi:multiphosphoryl transfer protein